MAKEKRSREDTVRRPPPPSGGERPHQKLVLLAS